MSRATRIRLFCSGFWRVQLANAVLYRRVARDPRHDSAVREGPAARTAGTHCCSTTPLLASGSGIGLLCVVFGWRLALLAAAVHAVTYLALNASINAVGHSFGSKSYANTAFNNQWLAFLTGGEGLHNNHHAAPTSAKLALGRHEMDPGWWMIRLMVRARAATVRLAETHFVSRSPASHDQLTRRSARRA